MSTLILASIVIVSVLFIPAKGATNATYGSEHLLYSRLFHDYTRDSRPVKNASQSVTITFALGLNQLIDLDEKNQVLSTSVWIYEEWKDELLVWSPEDFGGREMLMIPATTIWLPDIFIFNAAGETADGFVNVNGSKVSVRSDGRISWMVPLMVKSACAVDVTYFPYDRQTCFIKFISWIYDMDQVNIVVDSFTPDMEHYVMNSEYDLENHSISRGILNSSCCPGEGEHPMVMLRIQLKRKSLFYDYIVIAPTIMLCVLTLVSFMLPCDKGEKIAIGLNVFLTLYVLQLRIADNVPDTNSTPILGVFMLVVMTFNCVSLIMATLVMNIKKRGDNSRCSDVPNWLFQVCDKGLGRIVCTLWKNTSYIPLAIQEQVVEQETAFDGPDSREMIQGSNGSHAGRNGDEEEEGEEEVEAEEKEGEDEEEEGVVNHGATSCSPAKIAKPQMSKVYGGNTNFNAITTSKRNNNCSRYGNGDTLNDDKDVDEDGSAMASMPPPTHFVYGGNNKYRRSQNHQSLRRKLFLRSRSTGGSYEDGIGEASHDLTDEKTDAERTTEDCALPWRAGDVTTMEKLRRVNHRKRRWFYVAEVVDKFAFLVYLVLLTICIFTVLYLIPVHFRND